MRALPPYVYNVTTTSEVVVACLSNRNNGDRLVVSAHIHSRIRGHIYTHTHTHTHTHTQIYIYIMGISARSRGTLQYEDTFTVVRGHIYSSTRTHI
jgi:hypothetical protein